MIANPTKYKFTVDSLLLMEQAGVFPPDQRIELIDGEIIDMSPINYPHAYCVSMLNRFFTRQLSPQLYFVSIQNPVQLSSHSLPQPDVVIANFRENTLNQGHIQASDVVILVEVADSSYDFDRNIKLKEYASAGIPEYWIVNIQKQEIEVFTHPEEEIYTQIKIHKKSFETSLGPKLSLNEILPSPS